MRQTILALIAMLGLPAITSGQYFVGEPDGGIPQSSGRYFVGEPMGSVPSPSGRYFVGEPRPPDDSRHRSLDHRRSTLPLPPIGLPLPSIGLQPQTEWQRPARRHRRETVVVWPAMVFVVQQAATPVPPPSAPETTAIDKEPATGQLVLEVQPGTAQVFIDGYYVGAADDFSAGRGVVVETGPHRVELSAPGHETVTFGVRISSNQSVVYRRDLSSLTPQPSSLTSNTFYVVPGCYLGNVPPGEAGLPATCDISRTVTFTLK